MVDPTQRHSVRVGWAKILLPMFVLGLLSTLFLFARNTSEPPAAILERVEEIAREQRVTKPEYLGVTDDGARVVIQAQDAKPDDTNSNLIRMNDISVLMERTTGTRLDATAVEGEFETTDRIVRLLGLARLESSTGYQMETNGLTAYLNLGVVTSDGLLEIRTPFGQMTAGKLRAEIGNDDEEPRLYFTDGVQLLYEGGASDLRQEN